jgi:DNA-binding XRE family transcriptional regulator
LSTALIFPLIYHQCKFNGSFWQGKRHPGRRSATILGSVLYIGDKLRDLRKRALLTQEQLAETSGVGVTTIVRIERNQVEPHARTIRKLADALDVDPKDLLPR